MAKRIRRKRPKRGRAAVPPGGDDAPDLGGDAEALLASGARRGRVVTLFSGSCQVECDGEILDALLPSRVARRQQSAVAVGDVVAVEPHGDDHRVLAVAPRRTVLSRPDPHNPRLERVVAANVDVVVQVSSVGKPPLRPALIDRYLITIDRGGAEALLCVNKIDLLGGDELEREMSQLDVYREMGLVVLPCSARTGDGIEELRHRLAGKTAVFAGHSGVGKSSLLQCLEPELEVRTGKLSRRFARGRHTTTRAQLYRLGGGARVIDTPGIRELGLWQTTPEEVRLYFGEFDEAAADCRFNDCSHTHEPDCAVRRAVDEGEVSAARYATYVRILASLDED